MAVWTVLLGLSLLCGVPAFKSQLTSPSIPDFFNNVPGPLYNIPLGNFPGITYPVTQFVLRHWIYIIGIDTIDSNVLHIKNYINNNIGVYFESDGGLAVYNAEEKVNESAPTVPLGTWMMVLFGTQVATSSFGAYAFRGASPIFQILGSGTSLVTAAIYDGCNDADFFTVRGYIGLHCGRHH